MIPRIMGLDLSLTRTGVALPDGSVTTIRPRTRGCERMVEIRDAVLALCRDYVTEPIPKADVVVLEGFSFGSNTRSVREIGGIGWVVRVALHEAGIPFAEITPATLKKFATGKGGGPGADKAAMQMAAVKRLGYDSDAPDDNEVDALWLRAAGLQHYGHPVCQLPQAQIDALSPVIWPRLPAPVAS